MTDYYKKYIKYKTKYNLLKQSNMIQIGGSKSFIGNENKLFNKNIEKISKKISEIKDKTQLIEFINKNQNKKYVIDDFSNITSIINIIKTLSLSDMIMIDNGEHFNIFKIKKPNIEEENINDYILSKKLELSYSIYNNNKNINNNGDIIYPMHSIGKVFTGFLIMLLINEDIITENDILEPIKLDKEIIDLLPIKVIERLKETTMLDVMTHLSGLKNYLKNYFDDLRNNNNINPIEPIEFIKYIDQDVGNKGEYIYSNAGLLLCGLSIKHLYNKKKSSNKSYNDILYEYIIKPANLETFSITKPKEAIYNNKDVDIMEFVNGSPAGGYWISSNDLAKFGIFILDEIKIKPNIKKYLEKYGKEFYYNNIISHSGGLPGSNCWLTIYLEHDISVAIMDIDGKSSKQLKFAIDYLS
jgi:hypothetical protein